MFLKYNELQNYTGWYALLTQKDLAIDDAVLLYRYAWCKPINMIDKHQTLLDLMCLTFTSKRKLSSADHDHMWHCLTDCISTISTQCQFTLRPPIIKILAKKLCDVSKFSKPHLPADVHTIRLASRILANQTLSSHLSEVHSLLIDFLCAAIEISIATCQRSDTAVTSDTVDLLTHCVAKYGYMVRRLDSSQLNHQKLLEAILKPLASTVDIECTDARLSDAFSLAREVIMKSMYTSGYGDRLTFHVKVNVDDKEDRSLVMPKVLKHFFLRLTALHKEDSSTIIKLLPTAYAHFIELYCADSTLETQNVAFQMFLQFSELFSIDFNDFDQDIDYESLSRMVATLCQYLDENNSNLPYVIKYIYKLVTWILKNNAERTSGWFVVIRECLQYRYDIVQSSVESVLLICLSTVTTATTLPAVDVERRSLLLSLVEVFSKLRRLDKLCAWLVKCFLSQEVTTTWPTCFLKRIGEFTSQLSTIQCHQLLDNLNTSMESFDLEDELNCTEAYLNLLIVILSNGQMIGGSDVQAVKLNSIVASVRSFLTKVFLFTDREEMDESCIELIELALRVISKVQLIEGVASDLSSAYSDDDAHTDALDSFDFETLHPSLVESRVQLFMDTDQLSDIMKDIHLQGFYLHMTSTVSETVGDSLTADLQLEKGMSSKASAVSFQKLVDNAHFIVQSSSANGLVRFADFLVSSLVDSNVSEPIREVGASFVRNISYVECGDLLHACVCAAVFNGVATLFQSGAAPQKKKKTLTPFTSESSVEDIVKMFNKKTLQKSLKTSAIATLEKYLEVLNTLPLVYMGQRLKNSLIAFHLCLLTGAVTLPSGAAICLTTLLTSEGHRGQTGGVVANFPELPALLSSDIRNSSSGDDSSELDVGRVSLLKAVLNSLIWSQDEKATGILKAYMQQINKNLSENKEFCLKYASIFLQLLYFNIQNMKSSKDLFKSWYDQLETKLLKICNTYTFKTEIDEVDTSVTYLRQSLATMLQNVKLLNLRAKHSDSTTSKTPASGDSSTSKTSASGDSDTEMRDVKQTSKAVATAVHFIRRDNDRGEVEVTDVRYKMTLIREACTALTTTSTTPTATTNSPDATKAFLSAVIDHLTSSLAVRLFQEAEETAEEGDGDGAVHVAIEDVLRTIVNVLFRCDSDYVINYVNALVSSMDADIPMQAKQLNLSLFTLIMNEYDTTVHNFSKQANIYIMKLDWISYLNPCEKDNVNLLMKILYCIKSILERGKVLLSSQAIPQAIHFAITLTDFKEAAVTTKTISSDSAPSIEQPASSLHSSDRCLLIEGAYDVLNAALKFHQHTVLDCIPIFMLGVNSILKHSVKFGDDARISDEAQLDDALRLARNSERLLELIASHRVEFSKVALYIVAEYLDNVQHCTLHPQVKKLLVKGMFQVLDVCDEYAIRQLNVNLDQSPRQLFRSLYDEYTKFHKYSGKI